MQRTALRAASDAGRSFGALCASTECATYIRSSGPRWRAAEQALERMPPSGAPVSRAFDVKRDGK